MSDYFPPPPWTTEMQWHGTAIKATGQTLARVNGRADPWVEAATARLMAAAPDLLAALEGLQKERGHSAGCLAGNNVSLPCIPECAAARTAIRTARGLEDA